MARVTQRCTEVASTPLFAPRLPRWMCSFIPRPTTTSFQRRRHLSVISEVLSPEESRSDGSLGSLAVPVTTMARFGSSGGAATLQRSKLNLKREVRVVEPKTDDSGGGGNIGKIIHNGGGGGGDDDDDDDYFFEEGDDGEEGDDKFFSKVLPQLYDSVSVGAVLSEWYRTVADMPMILRRAVEMGLFSSAQLVRFLSMDVRPNATRAVQRSLPISMSRAFVGRLMADPAFCHKLIMENLLTLGFSLAYEMRMRGQRFMKEWDLAAINIVGLMAATTSVVWLIAPSRSYGAVNKLPWEEALSNLPNNVFDASGPLRQYTILSRVMSFLAKSLELAAVGAFAGLATSGLSHLAITGHKQMDPHFEASYDPPHPSRAAMGLSLFFGVHAHLRYQLLGGVDRYFFEHSNFLWSYLMTTGICRVTGSAIGEAHRPGLTGLPKKPVKMQQLPMRPQPHRTPTVSSNVVPAPELRPKVTKIRGFELTMSDT